MSQGSPKVFIATTVPPDLRAALVERFAVTDYASMPDWPKRPAPGFDVVVTTSMRGFDAAMLDGLPNARIILCNGAGTDRFDIAAARQRSVAVSHTPDELADDVGEAVIALTYAIMRRIAEADRFVRAGRWGKERIAPSTRVAGKTMGVVGLGRIGSRAATLAEGIGMRVIYHGRRRQAGVAYPFVADLHELARQCDVMVISCPAGEETRNLIDAAVLKALGPGGYLINVSRGSVVDEPALIAALGDGTIAGAALDVFENEPGLDPRFLALENVVLQPHSTSITHETRAAMIARLLSDLDAFLAGRPYYDAAAPASA
jgi:lactate dehydrogenase-like 2-hydroxyacid dehydrogenase